MACGSAAAQVECSLPGLPTSPPPWQPADEQDVLVPSGVERELKLEAENLPHPQSGHAGFQCLVDIEGAKMAIGARIEGGRFVVCDKTTVTHFVNLRPTQERVVGV